MVEKFPGETARHPARQSPEETTQDYEFRLGNIRSNELPTTWFNLVRRVGDALAKEVGLSEPLAPITQVRVAQCLSGLPWEFLPARDGSTVVALHQPLQRILLGVQPRAYEFRQLRRVLLVVAHQPQPALPGLARERQRLEELFDNPSIVLCRWDARKDGFSKLLEELARADIAHFACHGLPPEGDRQACLQLDGGNGLEIRAEDFRNLERSPRLVWLNACHSVLGGTGSMAFALAQAGCSHVIGSQFVIDDSAAGEAAIQFYRGLVRGESVGHAVWRMRAKLQAAARHDWMSIVSYGNDDILFDRTAN